MPEIATLGLFLAACLVLFIVPGPAVIYIVTRGITQGRRSGFVSVAGIHLASLVHIGAAVAGLSALIAASATAFTVVKLAGAGYLVFLGLQTLLAKEVTTDPSNLQRLASNRRVFWQGFVVNLLNPKTALFFLAFVPQFIDPAVGNAAAQTLVLGAVFIVAGIVSDGAYAFAAGGLGSRVLQTSWWRRSSRWVSGSVYLGLGLATALGGDNGD